MRSCCLQAGAASCASRPPQLETPFSVFNQGAITPNDAFFVRYHWSGLPTSIDGDSYRLRVAGLVKAPLALSLAELKQLAEPVDMMAVTQCSGISRGFFALRANGGQQGNGAMGNARWTGIPLKTVQEKAGIGASAVQVALNGLETSPVADGLDFQTALSVEHIMAGDVLLAWAMNGEDIPFLTGYPLRLIVPGFYGTYWVKHLSDITVLDKPFDGFWMSTSYRIPDNGSGFIEPGTAVDKTTPINRLNVRSFVTSVQDGAQVTAGRDLALRGIAFDGGQNWQEAKLGKDLGRFSFREWTMVMKAPRKGKHVLMVRAVNRIGQSQPMKALWNPMGYMRNVVETTRVQAV
ncbi:molybdopterin-dependent oxidoreductase [Janthinobacterium sp. RB2P8]|uniref:molybdopterin-dependent oxidoreductase n=1 Tax=Janthinobacterium sp. RB2P8 TaxID=3424191 RepID=UPI003F220F8F